MSIDSTKIAQNLSTVFSDFAVTTLKVVQDPQNLVPEGKAFIERTAQTALGAKEKRITVGDQIEDQYSVYVSSPSYYGDRYNKITLNDWQRYGKHYQASGDSARAEFCLTNAMRLEESFENIPSNFGKIAKSWIKEPPGSPLGEGMPRAFTCSKRQIGMTSSL